MFLFSAYIVFQCLNMFWVEKQVSEFLATHFGGLQPAKPSREFWRLAQSRVHTDWFRGSLATRSRLAQSPIAQKQLFKELFRGKLVLNLSHPLLNPSFNIFISKSNQFE